MVSVHEQDHRETSVTRKAEADSLLSGPESPFNFPGYVPPCAEYLYFDPYSGRDPFSGVPFQDVANVLGVHMQETTDGQPLAITPEGLRFVNEIGFNKFPALIQDIHRSIESLTTRLYPPDVIAKIQKGDNGPAYNELIHAIISGLDPSNKPLYASPPGDISMLRYAQPNVGFYRVHLHGSGTQHMVFSIEACGKVFICKIPSITTILGMRKEDSITRIFPAVSTLLQLQAVRTDQEMNTICKKSGVGIPVPYFATPYMLVEEYCGDRINYKDLNTSEVIQPFDNLTRPHLESMQSDQGPVGRILRGIRNFDIFTRGVFIDGEDGRGCLRGHEKAGLAKRRHITTPPIPYRIDNLTMCTGPAGVTRIVLVDPFRNMSLNKPNNVPDSPFPKYMRKNTRYTGGFKPSIFSEVFSN